MEFLNYMLSIADLAFRTGVVTFVILMTYAGFFYLNEVFDND